MWIGQVTRPWGSLEAQQAHCTQAGTVPRNKHVPCPRPDLTQTAPPTGLWKANCPTPSRVSMEPFETSKAQADGSEGRGGTGAQV